MTSKYFFPLFASIALLTGCSGEAVSDGHGTSTDAIISKPSDPVACAEVMPECGPGERVADVDGDGCALECEPVVCIEILPACGPGERVADVDGDGCALECEPVFCAAFIPNCGPGEHVADVDGDGCALECE